MAASSPAIPSSKRDSPSRAILEFLGFFLSVKITFFTVRLLAKLTFGQTLSHPPLTLPLPNPPFFHSPHDYGQCIFPKHGSNPKVSSWTSQ